MYQPDKLLRSQKTLIVLVCQVLAVGCYAGEFRGYVGAEAFAFFEDPLMPSQQESSYSASGQIEYFSDFDDGDQRIAGTLFARIDAKDEERTHADIRELYWWKALGSLEVYAGIRKVFWGVAESAHLVDVVNQVDLLEGIDREEKLGQPMLQLVRVSDYGTFEAFGLLGFREQQFPGEEGRLRPPLPVNENTIYESSAGAGHVDLALRWSHYFGPIDIGLNYFSGTARDPIFLPEFEGGVPVSFHPYYTQIQQVGLATQATQGAWLLKLEATSTKENNSDNSLAAVTGFEYSLFGVGGSETDLGLLLEYQYDDLNHSRQVVRQNDGVLGLRWSLNDLDGSEVLFLAGHDFDFEHQFYSLELSRRLTENWKLEVEAALFDASDRLAPDFIFRQDDYLKIEIKRYF